MPEDRICTICELKCLTSKVDQSRYCLTAMEYRAKNSLKPWECRNNDCAQCPDEFHDCRCHPHHDLLLNAPEEHLPCENQPYRTGMTPGEGDTPYRGLNPIEGGVLARPDGTGWMDILIPLAEGKLRICLPFQEKEEAQVIGIKKTELTEQQKHDIIFNITTPTNTGGSSMEELIMDKYNITEEELTNVMHEDGFMMCPKCGFWLEFGEFKFPDMKNPMCKTCEDE